MKKVNWNLGWGLKQMEGSLEVDDDASDREINELVIDDIFSSGRIQYDWSVSDSE